MRVLVTGGAGFIGSQFVRRLVTAGDRVVVLDKLTYAGNRANLEGVEHTFHQGDIADAKAVARAAKSCDAIVNFAAETHVDRSILGPAEFILTDVLGTQVLLDYARHHQIRHLQVSTDEVYGDIPLDAEPCTEDAPVRALEPVLGLEGGRRPAGACVRAHVRRRCADHARREHVRPAPVPGEVPAALHHQRVRRAAPAGVRGRQAAPRVAARRRSLRRDRAGLAQGCDGQRLQRRRPGAGEHGGGAAHPRPDRRQPRSRPARRRPRGSRPAVFGRLVEAPRSRLGSAALVRCGRPGRDRRLVPRAS